MDWDDVGPSGEPARTQWESERLPCPCERCKKAIARLRRVCLEHVEKWGLWDDQLKRARVETSDPHILAQIDVAPHWRVVGGHGRRRVEERMRQEAVMGTSTLPSVGPSWEGAHSATHGASSSAPPHRAVEDDIIHSMVEDLLAREATFECEDDCACVDAAQEEEDHLHQAASTPLYDGCSYSILRASLELLNLQAMFGWSSASVDALLRYLFSSTHPCTSMLQVAMACLFLICI